jgi:hypothetical protein
MNPEQAIPKTEHVPFLEEEQRIRRTRKIYPSPENDIIYKPVDVTDERFISLVESVKLHGILEPIVITVDGDIVSGHRRHRAAQIAGLESVPVKVLRHVRRSNKDLFVSWLVRYNECQREKTTAESLRELVVTSDNGQAYEELVQLRAKRTAVRTDTIELNHERVRSEISAARAQMVEAIKTVMAERSEFLPCSVRSLHYALCGREFLIHARKPKSLYGNNLRSYAALCDLMTRMRLEGEISMESIIDETRAVDVWNKYPGTQQYLKRYLTTFGEGYWRDLQQGQTTHVELVVEKLSAQPVLRPIAARYTIPMTISRGYCSLPPRAAIAERFRLSGRNNLVLVVASDFDADGESIGESLVRSLRDDFYLGDRISAVKAGITYEQSRTLDLPTALPAKETSSRYADFVGKYGDACYELEAVHPSVLQDLVEEAITSVIDVDEFNRQLDQEKDDAARLKAIKPRLMRVMADLV